MAEIVGAVASGFTLAGVAVGSARTVFRLKQLWSEVKEVPDTIQALMFKVELFESIILEMEQATDATLIFAEDAVDWGGAFARSSEHCQRQLKSLSDLITDLEAAITAKRRSRRGLASVKVALGGSRLAEFERRMRDVVDILVIAMNARSLVLSHMSLRHTSRIGRTSRHESRSLSSDYDSDVETVKEEIEGKMDPDVVGSVIVRQSARTSSSNFEPTSQYSFGYNSGTFGGFFFNKKTSTRGRLSQSEYAIQASTPVWLYGSAFNFQVTRAQGSWAMNLRTYNVRPQTCTVFALARVGNVKGVLSLIERKEASVYDINEDGDGILHMLFNGNGNDLDLASISSLLAIGADLNQHDLLGDRPTHEWLQYGAPSPDIFEYLDSRKAFDWEREMTDPFYFLWMDKMLFRRTTWHARFPDNISKLAIERFGEVVFNNIPHILTADEIWELASLMETWTWDRALATLSLWLGITTGHLSTEETSFAQSSELMVKALRTAAMIHRQSCQSSWIGVDWPICRIVTPLWGQSLTPLLHFLTGTWVCSCSKGETQTASVAMKNLRHQLMRWLKIIEEAGYALGEYGKEERLLFISNPVRLIRWEKVAWRDVWVPGEGWYGGIHIFSSRMKTIPFTAPKLVDIQYGTRPEDWRLVWDMDVEEMAGEFWLMLDDQKPIPGSWDPSWECNPDNGWYDHSYWSESPGRDDPRLQGQAYVPVRVY